MNSLSQTFLPYKEILKYKKIFILFIFFSLIIALSEGIGITTLLPLLEGISNNGDNFSNLPFVKMVIKPFTEMDTFNRLMTVAFVIALVGIFRGIALFMSNYLCSLLDLKVYLNKRQFAFHRILHMNIQKFHKFEGGKLTAIIESLTQQISATLLSCLQMLGAFILLLFHLTLLLIISWQLTLISGGMMILIQLIIKKGLIKHLKILSEKALSFRLRLNTMSSEVINGMKFIRLSGKEKKVIDKNNEISNLYKDVFTKQQKYYDLIVPAFSTAVTLTISILILCAGVVLKDNSGTIVSVLLFLIIITRLSAPVQIILQSHSSILKNICVFSEFNKFIDETTEEENQVLEGDMSTFHGVKNNITFNNITFKYSDNINPSLLNLNFIIPAKKTTALVGPSGAGKTTIINLLGRLYEPLEGEIYIDAINLNNIPKTAWLNKIGFVSQDIFLFNDTIQNNLGFVSENEISIEQIIEAAKLAYAHEFIIKLDEGYQTVIGDKGIRLSGGQQQRLAIARAILMQPDILILDEATSHLDSISETEIQQAINYFKTRCTIIIIAHRLSTIQNSDQILVFENGNLIQTGSHHDLSNQGGLYQRLTNIQQLQG